MKKDDKKPVYILCPRCDLNYINKKDKYCTVCKAEMGIVDPSILIPDEEEVGVEKLCPICHVNYLDEDEDICFICQKERDEKAAADVESPVFEAEELPDETAGDEELDIIPLSELEEEENEEDEEFETVKEPDDFDYSVDPKDFEDFDEDEEEDIEDDDF